MYVRCGFRRSMATRITVNPHMRSTHMGIARGCPFLGGQKRRWVRWPGSRSGAVELHRVRLPCVLWYESRVWAPGFDFEFCFGSIESWLLRCRIWRCFGDVAHARTRTQPPLVHGPRGWKRCRVGLRWCHCLRFACETCTVHGICHTDDGRHGIRPRY